MEDIYTAIAMFFCEQGNSDDKKCNKKTDAILPDDIANHIAIVINDEIHEDKKIVDKLYCDDNDFNQIKINKSPGKNSISFENGSKFIKIQIKDESDPLINEVIVNRILNKLETSENNIFSKYINHCIYNNQDNSILNFGIGEYETLIIEKMDITSLDTMFDNMPDPFPNLNSPTEKSRFSSHQNQYNALLKNIEIFVDRYIDIAKQIGLTHNDMHHNNIVFDNSNQKFKVIDYGRCSINVGNKYNKLICESASKFGLKYDNVRPLFNEVSDNKRLAFYQIVDYNLGYMTDIATICITALPLCGLYYKWPDYFKFNTDNEYFELDINKLPCNESIIKDSLEKGLLFTSLYIFVANRKYYNNALLKEGNKVHIDTLFKSVFWSNGICKNTVYHKVKDDINRIWTSKNIKNKLNEILNDTQASTSGGSPVSSLESSTSGPIISIKSKDDRNQWRKNLSHSMNSVIKTMIFEEFKKIYEKYYYSYRSKHVCPDKSLSNNMKYKQSSVKAYGGKNKLNKLRK